MLGAIFISLGSLFQYSQTLLSKQSLLMVLHFALELGQNFDKRLSPDLPNLKTLLVKEKSCFALYTLIILLELVVRLACKYGLGEKHPLPIGTYLHIHACYSYYKYNRYYLQQPHISQK